MWMIRNQILLKLKLLNSEMTELEEKVRGVISSFETDENNASRFASSSDRFQANQLLVQLSLCRVLSPRSSLDSKARRDRLNESLELNPNESLQEVRDFRWFSEATFAINDERAKRIAWQGTQTFWENQGKSQLSIDQIAAAFECMLVNGGLRESQAFLVEQLLVFSAFEQPERRNSPFAKQGSSSHKQTFG
jgi:hypothetical protein